MRLDELPPEFIKSWKMWVDSEFGKALLALLESYARPEPVSENADPVAYAKAFGVVVGYTALLDLIKNLGDYYQAIQQAQKESGLPSEYGARQIMEALKTRGSWDNTLRKSDGSLLSTLVKPETTVAKRAYKKRR